MIKMFLHTLQRMSLFILPGLCLMPVFIMTSCHKQRRPDSQILHLNLYCEPPSLDPRKAADATSVNVLIALFEGLTRIGSDDRPHPALAESIHISPDRMTYLFKLREAYWTNGAPVTAEDFAYAWRSILDSQFPAPFAYKLYVLLNAELVKEGKLPSSALGVKVLDEKTLEVKLQHPTPYFLELIAFPTFFPVPHQMVVKDSEWACDAARPFVSNGPFFLKRWDHENELLLKKNPLYWDAKHVLLEKIHFTMIDDTTTELYMFEQGELDWAGSPLSNLPSECITPLKKSGELFSYSVAAIYYYKINTSLPHLKNIHIRQALGYSIQRQEIVDHILQGGQTPATGLIPSLEGWEFPSSYFQDGDIEQAKKMFELGLKELEMTKEEFPLLLLSYNTNREHQKIAQVIQQQWKDVLGIRVELETFDWKSYLARMNYMEYQIGRSSWIGDFSDPISFLQVFRTKEEPGSGGTNETGWEHPLYQTLLKVASYESNVQRRKTFIMQAEELLIEEMPVIPLYYIVFSYVKKPFVKDVYLSPLGIVDYKWAWIDEAAKKL